MPSLPPHPMLDWVKEHPQLIGWLGLTSIVSLIATAGIGGIVVVRMSEDYFLPDRNPSTSFANLHPIVRWTGLILKNILGLILLLGGIAMLALPGQGLLTIFTGLVLLNFPGKARLELFLIRVPAINRAINWMRHRAGKPSLKLPEHESDTAES